MNIQTSFQDINGTEIELGSRVCVYPQQYHTISSKKVDADITIEEIDITRPKPLKDTPLYIGVVQWCDYDMAVIVKVTETLVQNPIGIASFQIGRSGYTYEVLEAENT